MGGVGGFVGVTLGKPEMPQRLPLMFIEPEAYFSGTPPSVTHAHTHLLEPSAVHSPAPHPSWQSPLQMLALGPGTFASESRPVSLGVATSAKLR